MMTLAEIESALVIALRAEPFIVGVVHSIVDLFDLLRSGKPVTQEQLDAARAATQAAVDDFDKAA